MVTRVPARTASHRFDINDLVVNLSTELDVSALSVDWQCGRHSISTPLMPLSRRRFRIDEAISLICSIKRSRPRLATLTVVDSIQDRPFGRVEIDLAELCRATSQPFITRDYRLNECIDVNATMTVRITTEALAGDGDKFSVDGDFAIELQQQLQEEKRAKQELVSQVDDLTARLFQETLRYEDVLRKTATEQQNQVSSLSQSSEGEIRLLRQKLLDQKVRFEARAQDDAERIRNEEESKARELLRQEMEKFQKKIVDLEAGKNDAESTSVRYREEAERLRKELNDFTKRKGKNDENEIVAVKDKILGRRVLKKGDEDYLNSKSNQDGVDVVLLEKVVKSMKASQDDLIQRQRAKNISEAAKNRSATAQQQQQSLPSMEPAVSETDEKILVLKNELKAAQEEAANQAKKAKMAESGKLMAVKQLELEKKWRETLQKQIDSGGSASGDTGPESGAASAGIEQALTEARKEIAELRSEIKELERAKADATRPLEREVQRLQDQVRSAGGAKDEELQRARSSLYKLQEDAETLQRIRDTLQGDLRKVQMELEMNVKQVEVEQRWRHQLQQQLDEIARERDSDEDQLAALKLEAAAAEQKRAQTEGELGQVRLQVTDLQQQLEHSRAVAASAAPAEMVSAVKKERDLLLDRAQSAELRAGQVQGQLDRANERIQELGASVSDLREVNATLNRDLKRALELSKTTVSKAMEMQQSPPSPKAVDRVWERRAKDAEEMLKMAQASFAETTKILEERSTMLDDELVQTRQRLVSISDELSRREEHIESLKKKLQEGYKERMDMNEYLNDLEIELANNKARFVDTIDELSNLENENLRLREKLTALGVKVTAPQRSQPRFTESQQDLP